MGIRVCIDIGGTFTDVAVVNDEDGGLNIFKNSTTPDEYARGVLAGLTDAAEFYGMEPAEFLRLCSSSRGGAINYGTTIATNALIQQKTARVGLICTEGHRDILTFREGGKDDPFDWDLDYPDPYVPRHLTVGVPERVGAGGEVVKPLDEDAVREAVLRFKALDVDVIAVSLLWSMVNPGHERRVGAIIEREWPGVKFNLSHLVNPIIGEYRRTIATVINASLLPIVGPYLHGFDERLKELGYEGDLSVVSCFGGILSLEDMVRRPIYSVDSGPTGAPVAGLLFARKELESSNAVTCDMGGTSFDVSRVTDGVISETPDAKVGFDCLGIRKVDTKSIGAGGGSIARVDSGGLLHVGPESAGAMPGPACYGRGGRRPTVTDANLVLGYLNPKAILGGRMDLNRGLAADAIQRDIAGPLGLDTREAAFSVWKTVCVNMTDAIRMITSWEGIDPVEYVFVSGGGAAGLHIIPMLKDLGVRRLIIPKAAGVLSAVGGLASDMVSEFQLNTETETSDFDYSGVNSTLEELKEKARLFLERNRVPPENRALEFTADARYLSQPWQITLPVSGSPYQGAADVENLMDSFHRVHEQLRGSREAGQHIAISTWRVKAVGRTPELIYRTAAPGGTEPEEEAKLDDREAYFKEIGGPTWTPVFHGDRLRPGNRVIGPAIVEEMATTLVVFPGTWIEVSALGGYVVHFSQACLER